MIQIRAGLHLKTKASQFKVIGLLVRSKICQNVATVT